MVSKVLVANRGEIAIRTAFRAAYELGIGTVAIYPYEDRNSLHRLQGRRVPRSATSATRCARICPSTRSSPPPWRAAPTRSIRGYGFLSENPELLAACAAAGITFVGPDAGILS